MPSPPISIRLLICGVLLSLLMPINPAFARQKTEVISEEDFTRRFCSTLAELDSTITTTVAGKLEISATKAQKKSGEENGSEENGSGEVKIFLDNAYREYQNDPDSIAKVLDRFAKNAIESLNGENDLDEIDRSKIIPIIKHSDYLKDFVQTLVPEAAQKSPEELKELQTQRPYREPLNKHISVFYAIDSENSIRFLSEKKIASLEMKPGELRKLAVKNLAAMLPPLKGEGGDGLYMVTAGGMYEASLILMDIWGKDNFEVDGDLVIAIPTRDLLLITGSNNDKGLKIVKEIMTEAIENGNYKISDQTFTRKDNQWVPFKK